MIKRSEIKQAQKRTAAFFTEVGIIMSPAEIAQIEVAGFGLNHLEVQGLEIVTYVNTDRYCAKELVLFPRQTCPEHMHPPVGSDPGKMETFRCRYGQVFLYVEGEHTANLQALVPARSQDHYTVFHEIVLNPGEQYTIAPGIFHWFQGGDEGAIVSEFSSTSRDEFDIFTDTNVERIQSVLED